MTSSRQRVVSAPAPTNGHRPGALSTPLSTKHRPRGYAALAVALIVACGALGSYLYTQAGAKVPVVMAVHDIPAGHTIDRSDLTSVEVSGGVTAVAGDHLSNLVGETAAVEILPNTLVQRAMVTSGAPLTASQAIVGVAAAPGQIPSSGLRPGDKVEVLQLPEKGSASSSPASPVLADAAMVFDVRDNPSSAGGSLLSLVVPKSAAAGIAAASNAGLIALVRVGG